MRSLFRLLSPARIAPKPPALQRDTIAFVLDDGRRIDVSRVRDPRARRVKLSVDERGVRLTLPAADQPGHRRTLPARAPRLARRAAGDPGRTRR